jgi:hypothetical protein
MNSINYNNNDTLIDPNPASEPRGNFRNFGSSINYNNNHKNIDPSSGSERCGNFREISGIQSTIIIMIHISTLTLGRN